MLLNIQLKKNKKKLINLNFLLVYKHCQLFFEKKYNSFTFLFYILLQEQSTTKIEQNKIEIYDKMKYFIEAINSNKKTDKIDIFL